MNFEHWQERAMSYAIGNYEIKAVIDHYFPNCGITGKIFKEWGPGEVSFADIKTRTIFIPDGIKKWSDRGALEWVILHECAHIHYKDNQIRNITIEKRADAFAACIQHTTEFGVKALKKFEKFDKFNLKEIQERINALKALTLR